jgi:transposase
VSAKKGALLSEKTKRGKGRKWMVLVDGQGIPLGAQLASASPAEVTLAESTIAAVRVQCWGRGRPRQKPKRIIADRLQKRGIELLAPHRRNRQRWWRQDGRKPRRYRTRWKVERTFAWLQDFRRLLVRQDRILTVYRACSTSPAYSSRLDIYETTWLC